MNHALILESDEKITKQNQTNKVGKLQADVLDNQRYKNSQRGE